MTTSSRLDNVCRLNPEWTDLFSVKLAFILLYSTIFLFATSGNLLVIYVVLTKRDMRTTTNLLICNLAASDLLVNFTSLWITPAYTYMGRWHWGAALCSAMALFQGTSIFVSALTLTAIAIHRYMYMMTALERGGDRGKSVQTSVWLLAFIWTVSLLLVSPYAAHMRLTRIASPCNFSVCIEEWALQKHKSVYGLTVFCVQFLLPFSLISFSYISIWRLLKRIKGRFQTAARNRRRLILFVSMVAVFFISSLPSNILNIARDFHLHGSFKRIFSLLYQVAHLISMSATCCNPILYGCLIQEFRKEFKATFSSIFLFGRRRRQGQSRQYCQY